MSDDGSEIAVSRAKKKQRRSNETIRERGLEREGEGVKGKYRRRARGERGGRVREPKPSYMAHSGQADILILHFITPILVKGDESEGLTGQVVVTR